ncbi:hypothetical protein, partial [uncultured Rikenella sp.]|uniref:hypothetical protein n=1 Tax=uncultured Rikenella sp. TaxID=368003 RepID=UPI002626245E
DTPGMLPPRMDGELPANEQSTRKYDRELSFLCPDLLGLPSEVYRIAEELLHDPALGHSGKLQARLHSLGMALRENRDSPEAQTLWRRLSLSALEAPEFPGQEAYLSGVIDEILQSDPAQQPQQLETYRRQYQGQAIQGKPVSALLWQEYLRQEDGIQRWCSYQFRNCSRYELRCQVTRALLREAQDQLDDAETGKQLIQYACSYLWGGRKIPDSYTTEDLIFVMNYRLDAGRGKDEKYIAAGISAVYGRLCQHSEQLEIHREVASGGIAAFESFYTRTKDAAVDRAPLLDSLFQTLLSQWMQRYAGEDTLSPDGVSFLFRYLRETMDCELAARRSHW